MYRLLKYGVLICLMTIVLATMQAQVSVHGVVRNGEDRKALEFVNVGVMNASKSLGTTTDAKGRYKIVIPLTDSVVLRFSFTGFEPQTVVLYREQMSRHSELLYDVYLNPSATTLQEVKVTDDKSRATSFTNIDIQRIENTVGPNESVESIIKTLPDVGSNNELSSQYSVRGGSFDENLVYINGVEIFRPMLVRSGQQEGMSIINPDMVDHILFSPGGFDVSYGDKMSSVLDITYRRPTEFGGRVSASLLGASGFVNGVVGERFTYAVGLRYHTNQYLFSSLDTKGSYTTSYYDAQGVFSYRISDHLDVSLLSVFTHNRYGLIPESQTTTFGSFMESLELDVYFDGLEDDSYTTITNALTFDWHPSSDFQLRWITSAQNSREQECYDIQSQFWLYELGLGADASVNKLDRGVGTFLEHARNYLQTGIYSTEIRATHYARMGNWNWGLKLQYEHIADQLREWKWVDSAGYAMPTTYDVPGDVTNQPSNPILQFFCRANNRVSTLRSSGYVQRELNFNTSHNSDVRLVAGLRGQYYSITSPEFDATKSIHNAKFLLSPRVLVSCHPDWRNDLLFRLSAGVYQQAPFYREYRYADGSLNPEIRQQISYQVMQTVDWNFHIADKPFKLTADFYYKYLTNLIPYTIDNLRVRYDAENNAVGYVAGVSLRVNGDFVEGLESWASVSLMKTQEDIEGDGIGWISRPTDQRFSFKMFLQDYIPKIPWWRMSLSFLWGSGMPATFPYQKDRSSEFRLPSYFRVDWGNTLQLSRFEKLKHSRVFRVVDDILVGVEVFNLFDHHNVVSFLWVSDYENTYYPVPNYLTARQFNFKLTVLF